MRLLNSVLFFVLLGFLSVAAQSSNRVAGEYGDIIITPIVHASVQVEYNGQVIQVDPWSAGDLSMAKPADLILVTDDTGHHLDTTAVRKLRKPEASVILTAAGHARFPEGTVLSNGDSGVFADIQVEAVGAYDMTPGRPFHARGDANGYVITLGDKRLFFSGVGECVPEIQALENIDVAFMPMNLPVDRMRPIPLAECVKTFAPAVVYLNHYDQPYARWLTSVHNERLQGYTPDGTPPVDEQDTPGTIQVFQAAIAGEGIEFRDGNWYPERSE